MAKVLVVDIGRCTGCTSCTLACSFEHSKEFSLQARIQIERIEEEGLSVPIVCQQCSHAPCVAICPSGALTRDHESGETRLLGHKCIGCLMCMQACPFGAITYNHSLGWIEKCDLCSGDPACVRVCTPQALRFVEANEGINANRAKTLAMALAARQSAKE